MIPKSGNRFSGKIMPKENTMRLTQLLDQSLRSTDWRDFEPRRVPASPHHDMTARGRDGMARYEDLPYRTCVGMMLINPEGLVFIGRRAGGIEHVDESHVWQMPQGGVDPGEDTWEAAKRELYEETSVRSVEKLGEVAEWL